MQSREKNNFQRGKDIAINVSSTIAEYIPDQNTPSYKVSVGTAGFFALEMLMSSCDSSWLPTVGFLVSATTAFNQYYGLKRAATNISSSVSYYTNTVMTMFPASQKPSEPKKEDEPQLRQRTSITSAPGKN